ncbi:hypothetical protein BDQ12DRAFT_686499 [Crucibulum laeve]|uniref:Uncharacterized protein n=1 Tax=Crucibulum laeve TaxID=68775 RepID=A0A5C3LX74_9AGAR|nr:hypothetical protein BDQ12DRAFT_686499 [Crucibulum laeve]
MIHVDDIYTSTENITTKRELCRTAVRHGIDTIGRYTLEDRCTDQLFSGLWFGRIWVKVGMGGHTRLFN